MYDEINSDNDFNKEFKGNDLKITLKKLSPNGKISGSIWYDSWGSSRKTKGLL